jgi:organic radical activating enzyme
MNPKIKVENTTFGIQINNSCNLSCNECLTFNNFDFKGVFDWETHADRYRKWGELCTFDVVALQGGEPYLHPDLKVWADNIIDIFEARRHCICTNGTLLHKNIELTRYMIDIGWDIVISVHDESQREKIDNIVNVILEKYDDIEIEEFLEDPTIEYSYNTNHIKKYKRNGIVLVETIYWPDFFPAPQVVRNGVISFEKNGDAVKNHEQCMAIPCSMMMHGIYYKCSLLSTFREASKQFQFESEALELLEEYKGCDPFDTEENIRSFFDNLSKPVPQCKLCRYHTENPPGGKVIPLIPTDALKGKPVINKVC